MLEPAINYKEQIERAFARELYTSRLFWYDGCIDNYDHEIKTEGDKYSYAITQDGKLIGYISYRVDWYASCAFNFGLIKFEKGHTKVMSEAIREVINQIESYKLHRIDFRCVGGNPAKRGYSGIIRQIEKQNNYTVRSIDFIDNIKDREGNYHNTTMFELIRKD